MGEAARQLEEIFTVRCFNPAQIWDMLSKMGPAIVDDDFNPDEWSPDFDSTCWLMVYADGMSIALHKLVHVNSATVEFHPNVLPEYRSRYRFDAVREAYRWLLENAPRYVKMTAAIPSRHVHITHFARQVGFRFEGVSRASVRIDGQIGDRSMFGITAEEMRKQLCRV